MSSLRRFFVRCSFSCGVGLCAAAAAMCLVLAAQAHAFAQSEGTEPTSAQQSKPTPSSPKPVVSIRPRRVTNPAAEAFAPAAAENAVLSTELEWKFGDRGQRGWFLYTALIQELIGTDAPPDSPEFAYALAGWQRTRSLPSSGILDTETMIQIVLIWQSRRIADKTPATEEQLVVGAVSDFYDTTRPDDLRFVEREAYAAYKRMIAAAAKDKSLGLKPGPDGSLAPEEKFLKIMSSFRTREYQEKLRRESPGASRVAIAVNSPHFTGRALDICVGGDPVSTRDENRAIQVETPVYKWLVRNAARFGFHPYFYEPWHWEYRPQ